MSGGIVLKGKFIVEVLNNKGIVVDREEGSNLIVNGGLEELAKLAKIADFKYIGVGTGTDAPANADTELQTEVVRELDNLNGGEYETSYKRKFEKVFSFGSGESYAITEAGLFDSLTASGSIMFDRLTFSAKNVDVDNSLRVTITITVSRP